MGMEMLKDWDGRSMEIFESKLGGSGLTIKSALYF